MSRAERRHHAHGSRRAGRARAGGVDHDFLRRAARAHFLIEEAQRHGITFSIEAGSLAVEYPFTIEPRFWRQLQEAILDNKQTIANYVYSRERASYDPRRRHRAGAPGRPSQ
jgi:hypothetical protein